MESSGEVAGMVKDRNGRTSNEQCFFMTEPVLSVSYPVLFGTSGSRVRLPSVNNVFGVAVARLIVSFLPLFFSPSFSTSNQIA